MNTSTATTLTPQQRKFLRAQAHDLKPIVMIGSQGLTEAVIRETQRSLTAHELIKIRVLGDDRVARETWLAEICAATGATPVQHIGKLLLIYRPADTPRLQLPGTSKNRCERPECKADGAQQPRHIK